MAKVYDQFDAAFKQVSAYAVLKDGKHVASVTLKHGRSVVAYVHWIGLAMTRGQAGGGGYDRSSAAVEKAAARTVGGARSADWLQADNFVGVLKEGNGSRRWFQELEANGYVVVNVIH